MDSQDSEPSPQTPVYVPVLQWLTEQPKLGPGFLQTRIQEVLANPEETKRKNVEHAATLSVDIDAIHKRWGLNQSTPRLPQPAPVMVQRTTESVDQEQNDVLMEEALTPDGPEEASTPGSDPRSDSTTTPVELRIPMQSAELPPLRKHSSAKRGPKTSAAERKLKEEKSRLNLATNPQKPSAGSESLSPATNNIATTPDSEHRSDAAVTSTDGMDHEYTPSLFVSQTEKYPVLDFQQWFKDITPSNRAMKEIAKKRPQSLTALESLKNCIARCELQKQLTKPADRQKRLELLEELRDHVHKAEFLQDITKFLVKAARILSPENGLPRIFGDDCSFPPDLKADSYQLYARWMRGEFEQNVLRGIITTKGKDRASDKLDPSYKKMYPNNAKYVGEGSLVLGQCWPSQLCTVRDGAHGSSQGGIYFEKGMGAYSIVLSSGGYKDEDIGDTIKYSGTEGKNSSPTEATASMIKSHGLGNVIRVIRSHQLPLYNKFRPKVGFRYDGLYKIMSFEVLDKEKAIHRFELWRCPGQEPIRCGDNASRRPTKYEEIEFVKVRA
jgi:hypothetical protein